MCYALTGHIVEEQGYTTHICHKHIVQSSRKTTQNTADDDNKNGQCIRTSKHPT